MSNIIISSEQKQYALQIQSTMMSIVKNQVKLGEQLVNAKKRLPHGHFTPMLESIGLAYRTANDYMALSKLKIISNVPNLECLANFNNSQIKKLDKMDFIEAEVIIKAGEFTKTESKVVRNKLEKQQDEEENKEIDADLSQYTEIELVYMLTKERQHAESLQIEIAKVDMEKEWMAARIAELEAELAPLRPQEPLTADEIETLKKIGSLQAIGDMIGINKGTISRVFNGKSGHDALYALRELMSK